MEDGNCPPDQALQDFETPMLRHRNRLHSKPEVQFRRAKSNKTWRADVAAARWCIFQVGPEIAAGGKTHPRVQVATTIWFVYAPRIATRERLIDCQIGITRDDCLTFFHAEICR
jgi:hypothetical protein